MVFGTCRWRHRLHYFIYDLTTNLGAIEETITYLYSLHKGTTPWDIWLSALDDVKILNSNIPLEDLSTIYPEFFI